MALTQIPCVMVAQDQWLGRGNMGGTHVHTLSTAQMPAHTHNTGTTIGSRNTSDGGSETIVYAGSTYASTSAGGGQAHPNMPPGAIVNFIIKT